MQRVSVFPGYQPLSQKLRNEQIEEESELPAATLEEEKKLLTEHEDKEKYFNVWWWAGSSLSFHVMRLGLNFES